MDVCNLDESSPYERTFDEKSIAVPIIVDSIY